MLLAGEAPAMLWRVDLASVDFRVRDLLEIIGEFRKLVTFENFYCPFYKFLN